MNIDEKLLKAGLISSQDELRDELIAVFRLLTKVDRDTAISWLEAEEFDLEDALIDYRTFHAIG